MRAPCKDCANRSVYCHSHCSAYLQFCEEVAKERDRRYKESLAKPERGKYLDRLYG